MKTRKDLDERSEDVETHRTCERGFEFFHLLFELFGVEGLRRRGRRGERLEGKGRGEGVREKDIHPIKTACLIEGFGVSLDVLSFSFSCFLFIHQTEQKGEKRKGEENTHRGHGEGGQQGRKETTLLLFFHLKQHKPTNEPENKGGEKKKKKRTRGKRLIRRNDEKGRGKEKERF